MESESSLSASNDPVTSDDPGENSTPFNTTTNRSIFRVPDELRRNHPKSFTPSCIAIGPFHPHLRSQEIEGTKRDYSEYFFTRSSLDFQAFYRAIRECVADIKGFYREDIHENDDVFTTMMVYDSSFILECFLRFCNPNHQSDDLEKSLLKKLRKDLIFLENQVPFLALEIIYSRANINNGITLQQLVFYYFQRYNTGGIKHTDVLVGQHFLQLLRSFLLPSSMRVGHRNKRKDFVLGNVPNASDLEKDGLQFIVRERAPLLDVELNGLKFRMPRIVIDDHSLILFRNIQAYEIYHSGPAFVGDYLQMLQLLVPSEKDAAVLIRNQVITPLAGTASKVASIIYKTGLDCEIEGMDSKFLTICQNLKDLCADPDNRTKTEIKQKYCKKRTVFSFLCFPCV